MILNILIFQLLDLYQEPFSYRKLPVGLRNSKKRLINIKDNDEKCFLLCHIRHLNQLKIHPERITQNDKKLIDTLDYEEIEYPVSKKDFNKIEVKNNIYINVIQIWLILLHIISKIGKFNGFVDNIRKD